MTKEEVITELSKELTQSLDILHCSITASCYNFNDGFSYGLKLAIKLISKID